MGQLGRGGEGGGVMRRGQLGRVARHGGTRRGGGTVGRNRGAEPWGRGRARAGGRGASSAEGGAVMRGPGRVPGGPSIGGPWGPAFPPLPPFPWGEGAGNHGGRGAGVPDVTAVPVTARVLPRCGGHPGGARSPGSRHFLAELGFYRRFSRGSPQNGRTTVEPSVEPQPLENPHFSTVSTVLLKNPYRDKRETEKTE